MCIMLQQRDCFIVCYFLSLQKGIICSQSYVLYFNTFLLSLVETNVTNLLQIIMKFRFCRDFYVWIVLRIIDFV